MADYSTIKGFTIQSLATDPYTQAALGGTWASGGALNSARQGMGAAIGAPGLTAGLCFGGNGPPDIDATEKYDGTTWTEVANLNLARGSLAGCGIQTAALAIGGEVSTPDWDNSDYTESFNGTSWAETGDLNLARRGAAAAGTTTAGLCFGGLEPPGAEGETETFNGTTWTEVADLNTARYSIAGGGTQTAALCIGGTPALTTVESWDGTSWSQAPVMTIGKNGAMAAGGSGIQTAGLVFGSSQSQVTESFNGTAWAAGNSSSTQHTDGGGSGSPNSAALMFGGDAPGDSDATEEYSASGTPVAQEGQVWYNTTSTVLKGFGLSIPAGTWSSGGNANTGRKDPASFGASISAALICAGEPTPTNAETETYNGTAWTELANLNTGRPNAGAGAGTTTAGLCFSGGTVNNESWNGSSWTEVANVNANRTQAGGAGTQTAAMFAGGYTGTAASGLSETWNGTSWTEGSNINTARYGLVGAGSTTAGIVVGGPGIGGGYTVELMMGHLGQKPLI